MTPLNLDVIVRWLLLMRLDFVATSQLVGLLSCDTFMPRCTRCVLQFIFLRDFWIDLPLCLWKSEAQVEWGDGDASVIHRILVARGERAPANAHTPTPAYTSIHTNLHTNILKKTKQTHTHKHLHKTKQTHTPSWLHLVGSGGFGVWGRDMGDAHKTYDVRWWSSMMMMMMMMMTTTTVLLPLLILFIIIRIIFKTINISIVGIVPTCHLACYWHVCHCLLVLAFVFDAAAEVMLGHASLISLCSLQHKLHLKRNGMCMDTSHPTLFPLQMNYCIRPIHTQSVPVHRWILTKSPLSNFTYWMQLDGKREQVWYCILFIACFLSLMVWTDSTVFDVYAGLMHGRTALSQEQLQRRGDMSHTSHCVCQNMSHCRSVFNSWHNACLWCFKHFTFCE